MGTSSKTTTHSSITSRLCNSTDCTPACAQLYAKQEEGQAYGDGHCQQNDNTQQQHFQSASLKLSNSTD
jgi:hypothetical protein